MEKNDLISEFLVSNKAEIQDNGFSYSTIKKIPESADKQWIVMFMSALGTSITLITGYYSGFINLAFRFLNEQSPYLFLGILAVFPIISLFLVLNHNKNSISFV